MSLLARAPPRSFSPNPSLQSDMRQLTLFVLLVAFMHSTTAYSQSVREYYQQALEAKKQGQYEEYLNKLLSIDSLQPYHPTLYKDIATAYAVLQKPKKAYPYLQALAWIKADSALAYLPEFQYMRKKKAFRKIMASMKEVLQSSGSSSVQLAYTLPQKGMHPEGITYDPQRSKFYVGGIRTSQVVELDEETGQTSLFLANIPDIYSITGMSINHDKRELWLCSNVIPETSGYSHRLLGQTRLYCYDLESKQRLASYALPFPDTADVPKHLIGDVALHPKTSVAYTTDSFAPNIYRTTASSDTLEIWLQDSRFDNLQGLCFDPMGEYLFVADYRHGLFRITVSDRSVISLPYPKNFPKGIDGLYWKDGGLVAIHNGIFPHRIVHYRLSPDYTKIVQQEALYQRATDKGEPTLGTFTTNNQFYFIANSPWDGYDRGAFMTEEAQNREVYIYELRIDR